ncbi:MAG: hypothetical protein K0S44_2588 [Bacteroidetes bacterium]|jgi:hypothetical protein|nr:hypothetical protein [Bacteroidota bacterium]
MKKASTTKKSPLKKADKSKDSGELRKPTKLKPLKEKEKKNWKNNLETDEEEDFNLDDEDLKLDEGLDDDDDDAFYDDNY